MVALFEFSNAEAAGECFEALSKAGGPESDFPGLTYAHDFVVMQGRYLGWLHGNCGVTEALVLALAQRIFPALEKPPIHCGCGQPQCE